MLEHRYAVVPVAHEVGPADLDQVQRRHAFVARHREADAYPALLVASEAGTELGRIVVRTLQAPLDGVQRNLLEAPLLRDEGAARTTWRR